MIEQIPQIDVLNSDVRDQNFSGPKNLQQLCAPYSQIRVGCLDQNEEILDFLDQISMNTKRGSITFERRPNFFSLCRVQGEIFFAILMRNDDETLGGLGVMSVSKMNINGKVQPVLYVSDLRLSDKMSRRTRVQFRRWYEDFAKYAGQLQELGGPKYILTSIFDENKAALASFVDRKNRKKQDLLYRPIFSYQNINILGRVPWLVRKPKFMVKLCPSYQIEALKEFLCSNTEGGEIVFSLEELMRKRKEIEFCFEDFLIALNGEGKIVGACLPLSDKRYRRAVLKNLSLSVKLTGQMLPVLGQPSFTEGESLRVGFLGFLKLDSKSKKERGEIVSSLLRQVIQKQRKKSKKKRFHTWSLMDAQALKMERELLKRGFVSTQLPATIYQVIHRDNLSRSTLLHNTKTKKPDFEVSFL